MKNYKYSDCLFYICNGGRRILSEFTKWNGYTEPTTLGGAACSSVGDGNIVISYNGSFRKSNNVGGKSLFKKFFVPL